MLTQVAPDSGLPVVVIASLVISLGLAPVFGLTTELIVGSAPPERAGAASGISETGSELGGALGISILGSIGVAIYRSRVSGELPAGVPAEAADSARDTLGGAVGVAADLPAGVATAVLDVARQAFVVGMQVSSALAAIVAAALAVLVIVMLRDARAGTEDDGDTEVETEARSRDTSFGHPAAVPDA